MDQKLQILAAAANSAGDVTEAQRISNMRAPVQEAIKSLDPIYAEIKQKREELAALETELSATAESSLAAVRTRFGGGAAAPASTDGATAPGEEAPAVEEAPAAEGDAAVEGGAAIEGDAEADAPAEADEAPAGPAAPEGDEAVEPELGPPADAPALEPAA